MRKVDLSSRVLATEDGLNGLFGEISDPAQGEKEREHIQSKSIGTALYNVPTHRYYYRTTSYFTL